MAAKVEVDIFANDKTGGVLGGISQGLGNILTTAGGFITGQLLMNAGQAITGAFSSVIDGAMEAQAKEAQLNNVIKSTGGAAGFAAQELIDYAGQLQNVTAFEDDAIIGAENLLLTFTNIKGDVFKDATGLILDLSTATGQDLNTSAIQLGKALNDPIAGIGALSRVGIQFTEDQKAMVKSMVENGDIVGAQGIIMAEVEREFGGSAEAFANTFAGKMQQFQNVMGGIGDTIGLAVLPILTKLMTDVVMPMVPYIQKLAENFSAWMEGLQNSSALQTITTLLGDMVTAIGGLFEGVDFGGFDVFESILPVVQMVSDAFNQLTTFSIEGTPLGDFFAFLQSWATVNGPGIMTSFSSIFGSIWEMLSYAFTAIGEVFNTAMGTITEWLAANGPLIQKYFAEIALRVSRLAQVFKVIIDVAKPILDALIKMILDLVTFIMAIVTGDWAAAWEAFKSFFTTMVEGIILAAGALWEGILGLFGTNSDELKLKWDTFWQGIVDGVSGWVGDINKKVGEFFQAGKNLIQGFIDGIKGMIPSVVKAIAGVPEATNSEMQERYVMKSPSRLYKQYGNYIMEGFANGLKEGATLPIKAMGDIIPKINTGMGGTLLAGGMGMGGGITINIDARDSLIDERWFATKFKTGVVQILRDTNVAFNG